MMNKFDDLVKSILNEELLDEEEKKKRTRGVPDETGKLVRTDNIRLEVRVAKYTGRLARNGQPVMYKNGTEMALIATKEEKFKMWVSAIEDLEAKLNPNGAASGKFENGQPIYGKKAEVVVTFADFIKIAQSGGKFDDEEAAPEPDKEEK